MATTETEVRFVSDQTERKSDFCWAGFSHSELNVFPHHVLAEHNIHSSTQLQTGEPFPFHCSSHLPYLPPNAIDCSLLSLRNVDPATSVVHKKYDWSNRIDLIVKKYRMKYNQSFESIQSAISLHCRSAVMPNHLAAFMKLIEEDPDSDFSGVTNWYYTGGRLSHIAVDKQELLLTSGGENSEQLFVIPLTEQEENGWQPELTASTKERTTSNEPILQIAGRSVSGSGLIGVRQRNLCSVFIVTPTKGSFSLRGTHRAISAEHPFTSIDFSEHIYGVYCTSSVNRQVSLWDAQSCACITSDVVQRRPEHNLPNRWCNIQFHGSPDNLVMADAGSLSWLDSRIGLSKPTTTFCLKDQLSLFSACEDISLVVPSVASRPNLYVATSHHVCEYDPRSASVVQRWTHLLRSPPLYGQTMTAHGREMLCVANQEPAEVELIVNGCTGTEDVEPCSILPRGLPTLRETLHESQMRGRLLDPRTQTRLKVSLTGVLCLPRVDGESYQILTQTSLGDVFSQDLKKSEADVKYSSRHDDCIKKWDDDCLEMNCKKTLKITGEQNYKRVFDNLKNPRYNMRPYDREYSLQESLRMSKGQLLSYKDMLAPELLSAWNIESLPEWADNGAHGSLPEHLDQSFASNVVDSQQCTQITVDDTFATEGVSFCDSVVESHQSQTMQTSVTLDMSRSVYSRTEQDFIGAERSVAEETIPTIRPTVQKTNMNRSDLNARRRSNVSGF